MSHWTIHKSVINFQAENVLKIIVSDISWSFLSRLVLSIFQFSFQIAVSSAENRIKFSRLKCVNFVIDLLCRRNCIGCWTRTASRRSSQRNSVNANKTRNFIHNTRTQRVVPWGRKQHRKWAVNKSIAFVQWSRAGTFNHQPLLIQPWLQYIFSHTFLK